MTSSSIKLDDITLEDLKLPKNVLSKLEDGSYDIDADALTDFYRSDRGQEHFDKMEERLVDALDKKYEKKRDQLDEKWGNLDTDEDEARYEKEETKIDDWYEKEGQKIQDRMKEINRVWDNLVNQSIDKIVEVRGTSSGTGAVKVIMIVVILGLIILAAIFTG